LNPINTTTNNSEYNNNNNNDDDDEDNDSKNKNRKLVDISLFTIPTTAIITDLSSSSSDTINNTTVDNTDKISLSNKDTKIDTNNIDQSKNIILESKHNISFKWYDKIDKMTKGNKKNKNIQVLKDVKIHNFWDNIFRRKAKMHSYFSETAFGSDADKLIENRNIWNDPHFQKKYGAKKNNNNNSNK
jgi:hypothetical protein